MILKIYIKEDIVNNYEDLNEGKFIDALIVQAIGSLVDIIDISSEHSTENDCLKIICTLESDSDDINLDDIEAKLCDYIDIYKVSLI